MAKKPQSDTKLVAEHRRARFDYLIEDTLEAGIVLLGTEVKALRQGRANIAESYAAVQQGELILINSYIPEYAPASRFNHEPRRQRKLLLKKREMARLKSAIEREGRTLVPTKLYFNARGIAKLELALAKGKKAHDKRASTKERDWQRDKARLMREKG
jgi:SsrA-binding protein